MFFSGAHFSPVEYIELIQIRFGLAATKSSLRLDRWIRAIVGGVLPRNSMHYLRDVYVVLCYNVLAMQCEKEI